MKVVEEFSLGKTGDAVFNEDKIVITPHYIALMDGVTSRQGFVLEGKKFGRFAVDVLAGEIERLSPGLTAREVVTGLTKNLHARSRAASTAEGKDLGKGPYPAAALLIYSASRREIWRVADSSFMVDRKAHYKSLAQDDIWSAARAMFLTAQVMKGVLEESLLEKDPSWDFITPLVNDFKLFTNFEGRYGYGVLNGVPVPDCHVEVCDARSARDIVLASDGYPVIFPTLDETEKYLAKTLKEDPLMYRLHPQIKGMTKGQVSYDDRSYVRFSI